MKEAFVEMYLAGVSPRRVEDITEALWGNRRHRASLRFRVRLTSWGLTVTPQSMSQPSRALGRIGNVYRRRLYRRLSGSDLGEHAPSVVSPRPASATYFDLSVGRQFVVKCCQVINVKTTPHRIG